MPRHKPTEQTNNEEQECKTGHVKGRVPVDRERTNEEGKSGSIWLIYFYICMNMEH
jgi:hypothetical protein